MQILVDITHFGGVATEIGKKNTPVTNTWNIQFLLKYYMQLSKLHQQLLSYFADS